MQIKCNQDTIFFQSISTSTVSKVSALSKFTKYPNFIPRKFVETQNDEKDQDSGKLW